jgi:hypothetical protein
MTIPVPPLRRIAATEPPARLRKRCRKEPRPHWKRPEHDSLESEKAPSFPASYSAVTFPEVKLAVWIKASALPGSPDCRYVGECSALCAPICIQRVIALL